MEGGRVERGSGLALALRAMALSAVLGIELPASSDVAPNARGGERNGRCRLPTSDEVDQVFDVGARQRPAETVAEGTHRRAHPSAHDGYSQERVRSGG